MSGRISTAVAEEGWAGRRLPGIDDASLMAHPEPAVQSFQDLHGGMPRDKAEKRLKLFAEKVLPEVQAMPIPINPKSLG